MILNKTIKTSKEYQKNVEELKKIELTPEQLKKANTLDESLIETCKKNIKFINEKKDKCIKKIAEIISQINETMANVDALSDKNICPLCQTNLDDNNVKDQLLEKVRKLEVEFVKHDKEEELKEKIANEDEIVKQYREHIQTRLKLISKIEKLQVSIDNVVNVDIDVEDRIERYNRVVTKQKDCLLKLNDERIEIERNVESNNIKLKNLRESIIKHNNIENKLKILKQERKLYHNSKEETERKEKRVLELQKEIDEVYSSKIEKLESLFGYFSTMKDLCKDDRVKQEAIASIMPLLAERTNEYLSTVGFEFYVQLDSWLDATFRGPGIPGCGYNALSGGESKSVDVSLQMAFHDICRLKARNLIDIMVLDELLDTSVDNFGMKKILDIVKNKQEQDNLKVYIISHRVINEEDFDKVLVVEKQRGFSIVREK